MTLWDALFKSYTRYSTEPENLLAAFEIVENLLELMSKAKESYGVDWADTPIIEFLTVDLEDGQI